MYESHPNGHADRRELPLTRRHRVSPIFDHAAASFPEPYPTATKLAVFGDTFSQCLLNTTRVCARHRPRSVSWRSAGPELDVVDGRLLSGYWGSFDYVKKLPQNMVIVGGGNSSLCMSALLSCMSLRVHAIWCVLVMRGRERGTLTFPGGE